jgi:two-component system, NtrC family, response regulator HydG
MKNDRTRLLVIDDDLDIQDLIQSYYGPRNFEVVSHTNAKKALELMENGGIFDLILTDLKMPEMSGIEFVNKARSMRSDTPIIVLTAHGNIATAVEAIQAGAYDFVSKPIDFVHLNVSLDRALQLSHLKKQNDQLRQAVLKSQSFEGIVGKSPAMHRIFDLAKRVANSTANVLITGESGTGKEVIARAIHQQSDRKNAPFVAINCSAIPENLLESELFGHAKGAFTGAIEKKLGLFEEAEGGVLFLDEIGDMHPSLQTKLLRVLQERKIKRIGENQYRSIDVRLVAATHRDLKQAIEEKRFREDLFYRLCVIPIKIPPLRDRTEDILPLAHHFLEKFGAQNSGKAQGFTKAAMDRLLHLSWRGNVRELENVIERAVVLCDTDLLGVEDLLEIDCAATSGQQSQGDVFREVLSTSTSVRNDLNSLPTLEEFTQRYVAYVLDSVSGVKERAARVLEIDRKTLQRKTQNRKSNSDFIPEPLR